MPRFRRNPRIVSRLRPGPRGCVLPLFRSAAEPLPRRNQAESPRRSEKFHSFCVSC
nr:MAG TPA: hypothetical protein [Caudoviricetes sp.]